MKKMWLVGVLMLLATACAGDGGDDDRGRSPVSPGTASPPARGDGSIAFIRVERGGSITEGVVPSASLMLLTEDGRPRVLAPATQATPAWSPDGSRLAFLGRGGLWLLAEGGEPERLTRCHPSSCYGDGPPAWSPDGASVAFSSDRQEGMGLWIVPSAGGDPILLARDLTIQGPPSWSPDGSAIAVIATGSGAGGGSVVLVDPTSGEIRDTLTPTGLDLGGAVAWSPDGESLLVGATAGPEAGAEGVYLMRPDGSDIRPLTSCPDPDCVDVFPTWSPDGTRVLFTRGRCDAPGGDCYSGDLFAVSVRGGRPEQLTRGPSLDCCAAWQPVVAG